MKAKSLFRKFIENYKKNPRWIQIFLPILFVSSLLGLIGSLRGTTNWSNATVGLLIVLCIISIPVVGLIILWKKYPSFKSWASNPEKNHKNAMIVGLVLGIVLIILVFVVGYFLNCYLPLGPEKSNTSMFKRK